ncbi:MAG: 23S rRNA (adenine(2503)-C(2))-methyltransferase RlmN [Turneriella sp.]|nr:23S rRNA (adenine(2503)-C(2))-methyltransferase RlmN [Leptospiraceae bacterium]MCX7632409.1 23S rRNA (adenine(2503)-C(2))-methyltransferase RlmN [Turneriella sp.]
MSTTLATKPEILAQSEEELTAIFTAAGHKKFRARQVFRWLHLHQQFDPEQMTDLRADFREYLRTEFLFPQYEITDVVQSQTDKTEKYLFAFGKKEVEAVWLPFDNRQSICISVQSGCSLDCSFCATGKIPFRGNLSAAEILTQVYAVQKLHTRRISNVVFMGMGEPFYNYDNTLRAAHLLAHPHGMNISRRKIAISTSGVLPGIRRFIEERQPFCLAFSLHAVFREKRRALMDIEDKYPFEEILEYLWQNRHALAPGQLMLEYILIDGVNMFAEDARELARWAKRLAAKVNLIPLNTDFAGMRRPTQEAIDAFWQKLANAGVLVTNRRSPARDIHGACGMLAGKRASGA